MLTVSDLSLIQWPSRSGLLRLPADLSTVAPSGQAESWPSGFCLLEGRLVNVGLPTALPIAKGGADTARTAERPRTCLARDGPEITAAHSATRPWTHAMILRPCWHCQHARRFGAQDRLRCLLTPGQAA